VYPVELDEDARLPLAVTIETIRESRAVLQQRPVELTGTLRVVPHLEGETGGETRCRRGETGCRDRVQERVRQAAGEGRQRVRQAAGEGRQRVRQAAGDGDRR